MFFLFVLATSAAAAPWPEVESDLPPDPAAHFGTLPNGLRYVILPNAEPRNRISLRLLVAVGSLHERDYERGIAHFIEHMAFRGTRRHPGDSLAQELAGLGIGFGPDNTAFTGYASTSYHLDLPDASRPMLRRGLDVLHEYAAEIAFRPGQIERERGVILSERALRDTPSARLAAAQLQFLFPTAREVRRAPIGLGESIRTFTQQQLIDFYDAWYRPERLAVIIVGNVEPADAENLVTEIFGSLRARGPARDEPADLFTSAASTPTMAAWFDTGLVGAEFSLRHATPDPAVPDTAARRLREAHRALALAIMQRRLNALPHGADGVFVSPTATLATPVPGWLVVGLTVAGSSGTWKTSAAALEQEQRRALLYGFTPGEVATATASLLDRHEQAVRSAATRPSEQLATALENSLLRGRVFATPTALRDDLAPKLAAATPRECAEAFRALWTQQPPHVFVGSSSDLNLRKADIALVLDASRAVPVDRPVNRPPVKFAYADPRPPGALVRDDPVPDLELHLAAFANGVRVNFKPTSFEADVVQVRVRVGTGQLSQPRDQPGLNLLAVHALTAGGVRRHTFEQLREILSGHAIDIAFDVETDACVFNARCAPAELPLCLRIITAYLTDAAYRSTALRDAHADFGAIYANLSSSPSGYIAFRAERTLVPDDARFGFPEISELFTRTLGELSQWLEPQFKHGAIETAIVGDITWAEASAAVAGSLGTLPPRDARPPESSPAPVKFAAPSPKPDVIACNPRLEQAAVGWFWPVPDQGEIHAYRRAMFLAAALTERLRLRLREGLGVAYAPSAAYTQHEGLPSFAYFSLYAEVAGDQITRAAGVIRREIDAIRTRGFGDEDFLRVRQPFLRTRVDDLRSNTYWCYAVLDDAQQRPARLDAARDRIADSSAITHAEIDALARRYLDPAAGFMFVAEPGPTHLWGRK